MSTFVSQGFGIKVLFAILFGIFIVKCVHAESAFTELAARSSVNNADAWRNLIESLEQEVVPDPRSSNMMWTFMIMKGCQYLMAFIHSNYHIGDHMDDHGTSDHDLSCDEWRQWAEHRCHNHGVPDELCCAIINCGQDYTAAALSAPHNFMEKCNVTVDGLMMSGKRSSSTDQHFNSYSSSICPPPPDSHLFGKRSFTSNVKSGFKQNRTTKKEPQVGMDVSTVMEPSTKVKISNKNVKNAIGTVIRKIADKYIRRAPDLQNTYADSTDEVGVQQAFNSVFVNIDGPEVKQENNESSVGTNRTVSFLDRKVERWCDRFSWKVNRHFDFNKVPYVRQSKYWVVDAYKMASRHKVPTGVTHSLVGCGIDYVIRAFHVSREFQYFRFVMVKPGIVFVKTSHDAEKERLHILRNPAFRVH